MSTKTLTTNKYETLLTSKGKVKFLAVAKPRPAFQNKKDKDGNTILEYSIRLEFPTNALGQLGNGEPTPLKTLIRSIEGKVRASMSRINPDKETDTTFELAFKSKKQPKVTVGSGTSARTLTLEEIQTELGSFNGLHDTAEASVSVTVATGDDSTKSPSIYLDTINILSSNITEKKGFNVQDNIDALNALYEG